MNQQNQSRGRGRPKGAKNKHPHFVNVALTTLCQECGEDAVIPVRWEFAASLLARGANSILSDLGSVRERQNMSSIVSPIPQSVTQPEEENTHINFVIKE